MSPTGEGGANLHVLQNAKLATVSILLIIMRGKRPQDGRSRLNQMFLSLNKLQVRRLPGPLQDLLLRRECPFLDFLAPILLAETLGLPHLNTLKQESTGTTYLQIQLRKSGRGNSPTFPNCFVCFFFGNSLKMVGNSHSFRTKD